MSKDEFIYHLSEIIHDETFKDTMTYRFNSILHKIAGLAKGMYDLRNLRDKNAVGFYFKNIRNDKRFFLRKEKEQREREDSNNQIIKRLQKELQRKEKIRENLEKNGKKIEDLGVDELEKLQRLMEGAELTPKEKIKLKVAQIKAKNGDSMLFDEGLTLETSSILKELGEWYAKEKIPLEILSDDDKVEVFKIFLRMRKSEKFELKGIRIDLTKSQKIKFQEIKDRSKLHLDK